MPHATYLLSFQVQHVYPPQVQYVEGADAVYTNGALYVGRLSPQKGPPRRQAWAASGTFSHDSPHPFPFGAVCVETSPPPPLGDVGTVTTVLGHQSPVESSEITGLCSSHCQKRQPFQQSRMRNKTPVQLLSQKIQSSQSRHHFCLCLLVLACVHLWLFMMLLKLDFPFVKDF